MRRRLAATAVFAFVHLDPTRAGTRRRVPAHRRHGQASFGARYFSVDFSDTDHAAVARAFGMEAHRVTDPARLEGVLREAVSGSGPCLVDVVCRPLHEARAPVSEWIA